MRISIIIIIISLFTACKSDHVYRPKPRLYPKVDFPDRNYINFDEDYCQLTFNYPDYSNIKQELQFFDEKPLDPCWFDIAYPPFNGNLHCSYYPIEGENTFDKLVNDAFTFVDKHDIKANYREETVLENKYGNTGILFEIDGPVATPIQFFLTDSIDHFFRGSLYFNNKVNPDSMKVVHEFVKADILRLIETLQFTE